MEAHSPRGDDGAQGMTEQPPVTPDGPSSSPWEAAAQRAVSTGAAPASQPDTAPPSLPARLALVGAHGGAGVTTWARILDGDDAGTRMPADGATARVVLVARASAAGIDAAKAVLSQHAARVASVLLVPAAPGRAHRVIHNELRVLRGAGLPVVSTPWISDLLIKRPDEASADDVRPKDLARVQTELTRTETEGETS